MVRTCRATGWSTTSAATRAATGTPTCCSVPTPPGPANRRRCAARVARSLSRSARSATPSAHCWPPPPPREPPHHPLEDAMSRTLALLQAAYQRAGRDGVDAVVDLLDPQVEWLAAQPGRWDCHNRGQVLETFRRQYGHGV